MRSPIWLILHDPKSTTGTTERWCVEKGIRFEIVQAPELKTGELPDAAIIFGGDMQVWETEKYPWLSREKAFVAQMLNADKPILGLCLGAQLIAEQLGGEVTDMGMNVIGWFPVQAGEETILPFHCHSSKFSLPAGTVRIAGDEMINQGFRKSGHQLGLQFHAEMDRPRLAHALEKWSALKEGRVQEPAEINLALDAKINNLKTWYFKQLNAWWNGRPHVTKIDEGLRPIR